LLIGKEIKNFSLSLPKIILTSNRQRIQALQHKNNLLYAMKRTTIAIILAATLVSLNATAQKKKTGAKKKVAPVEQKAPENPKIVQMLSATQRIIFVDSIVVDKQNFLKQIRLNPETGTLSKATLREPSTKTSWAINAISHIAGDSTPATCSMASGASPPHSKDYRATERTTIRL
jgi:hypothetical protein